MNPLWSDRAARAPIASGFEFSATRLAMWNTFLLGFLTATIGTAIALVAAYMVSRSTVRGSPLLGVLATAPVAIPGIVLGVGVFPMSETASGWIMDRAYNNPTPSALTLV